MRFLYLVILVVGSFSAESQKKDVLPPNALKSMEPFLKRGDFFLKLNPTSIALFSLNIQAEALLSNNLAINIAALRVFNPSYVNTFYTGYGLVPSVKFYRRQGRRAINFIEPTLRLFYFDSITKFACCGGSDDVDWARLTSLGLGLNVGRLVRISKAFYIEIFGGVHYSFSSLNIQNLLSPTQFDIPFILDGFSPNIGFKLDFKIK